MWVTDCIQNFLCPIFVIGVDNHNSKSVRVTLHLHAFRVINVQVYASVHSERVVAPEMGSDRRVW